MCRKTGRGEGSKKETAGSVRSHKSCERVVQSNLLGRICLAIWSEKRQRGGSHNVAANYKRNIPGIMDVWVCVGVRVCVYV